MGRIPTIQKLNCKWVRLNYYNAYVFHFFEISNLIQLIVFNQCQVFYKKTWKLYINYYN